MSFSVRIVNADLYTAAPLPGFDCLYSTFRESKVIKVPVIRIFGSTPNGQRTCLHVHGVFPYIFIPYDGSQPTQNYLKQFATSVDFAVHVSMGKASSSTRHVHDIVIVKARPYYGYHEEEREFMKISFYNPFVVPRVVSLLQNGAIMNKVFQPHESHIPYIQQMFIDYNLYGMNLLHASPVKFRTPLRLKQEDESSHTAHVPDFSPSTFNSCKTTPSVFWSEENIPSHWIHDPEVERLSISELEVDVKAEDILNQIDIESNIGTSPGLAAIWEEERERRRNENDDIPVTLPVSQDRGDLPLLEAEAYYKEKIRQIIGGRDLEMQTSPVHNKEGQIPSPLLKRNSEQEDVSSPSYHDASVDEPIVDESIVQEVVQSSQRMLSQDIVSSTDMEMVKMLVSLEDDDGDDVESHSSQLLKIPVLSPPPMRELKSDEGEAEAEEAEKDEEESILMSQQVWDDTDPDGQDEEESILMSQQVWDDTDPDGQDEEARVSQFDLEGLDESWEISQLDGVNDDDSGVTKQNNTSRRSGRLGMSSIRIPIKPCKANDKKQHVEKGNSTPSNEPATHPMFSLQLSETSSSEGENLEEHSGRDTREGEDSKMLVGKRPKESPISYEAIRSLVFTGYSKSTTRKGKRKEKKLTKVKSAVMEKSRLSSPRRSLRNHEDRKEQNRRYKLRNTNPSCSKVADNTRTPDGSTVMTGSYDVERTSLDQPCGDQCLGNSIPLSRQGCRTKLLPDLKVVLDNIAFSQDLREVFVAALKRKKASLQKLKANLHRPLSSSDNEAMSTNVVVSRQPTIKKQTPARRSPKSKRYGVLDITVHTSPLKEKNAVATEHALPTRRRLVDQLEHVDSPLDRLYRNNSVMTSDGLTRIHERGVKRNSSEIISHQDNNKRLCLKLKKKTELTSVVGSNEDATTEEEFIGCLKAVQTRQDDNGKEGPLITTGGGEDRVDIRHQVTCIPSSPLEDLEQSRHVVHAPSLLQQPADTGLLNGALFNMSFLSPCAFESDKSSSPPSPSTPTKDRVNNSCKSIADRHSTKPSFDDSLLNVPDDRISKGSDANNRVRDHWVRQPQVKEQSPHYLLRLSNEPNRTQDQQQDEPMNTLDVSSGTTFITKGEKISCLNAIRQYCLLLKNIKRALLGDIDEEGLMVHKDHTPPYTLPVATCTSNRLSIKESDQNAGSVTCPVQDFKSDQYTVSVTHSTSKELSTQNKKSDGHTVSVTHSTSKELSTQDKKSDGHTASLTHSTSKELSTQDKKSDGHTVSVTHSTSKELSTQDKKSDGHTVSVTHSTSKELSTQDKKSDGHTVSVTHSTSKELSTQDKKSDGHTVSQERETDEEEQRLFSGVSSDSRSRNSFGLFDEPPSGQSSDNSKVVAVLPGRKPPTPAVLMETLEDYGIARCRHQQPYYSNPDDVPENTMDVGGRLLKVQSQTLKHLPEFDTRSPVVGIRDWRQLLCADHECHQDMGGAEGFVKEIENNPRLRLAFMGDKPVVVTPCKIPPSPLVVSSWAKDKLMKYKERKKLSDDGNDGEQRKSKLKLSDADADISDATHQQERTNPGLLFSHTDKGKTPEKDEASPTSMNEYLGHQSQDRCTASAYRERSPSTPSGQLRPRILSAPQHSTPILSHHNINPSQLPILTPINLEATDKSPKESTDRSPGVIATQTRRQSIPSQLKFVTPDTRLRRCVEAGSDIEGPSPINTGGFKMPQMNMRDSKPSHEVQHVTLLSIELHVRTRKDLRPDPEFDPVCAIFFHAQTDSPLPAGKNKLTGIICVCKESSASDLCTSTTRCQDEEKRPLLGRSGVTQYVIQYAQEEKELFGIFLQLVRKWDPDILIGYEVQMLSWGYLIQRALVFDLDLCKMLSRVTGSSSECNMDAEKDMWGAAHASELRIAGRIVLNVWRLMRHEVALNTYTFENVAFHVLHERIPLFTYRTLSDWWDHKIDVHRWRTVNHYITRCHGNVRILEQVDFIGRTSELSRLFGILFYSVISRGSQFRVESMMLRIAKPMNYIPLSPSHQQIRNMCAPEVIPLVMEPESRFYSDPVLVLDFQSLYPSIVIAYNYCYSTCLGRVARLAETGEFKFGASSLSVPSTLLKKLEDDIHVSPNGVAFVKPRVRRGVLPRMLEDILNTRIMVKNSMKKWKNNKSVHRMLDARQLGLKLIANVTFGYTAANFSGRMPCVEISDSIIRKARETLEYAIKLVNNTSKWGARVVYGDTDSMFVLLKGVTKEEAFRIGQEIVDTVTSLNPKPVKLKFEKVYLPCVLQTKKRYVGYMYETLDQKEPVFDAKGIETVRRDTCPAVAKVLEKSLRIMFETKDISLVKRYVKRQFTKVFQGRISLQDLTFAKEYRGMSSYQPGACVPALELTRRMLKEDRRSEPRVGERVPYVVTYGTPGLPLIRLVKRPLEVLQDSNLRINAMYYITKQMIPPLNRVLTLIGVDVNNWFADVPRIARVRTQPFANSAAEIPKKTISHYFYKTNCPVCQEITSGGLCETCSREPQKVLVILQDRLRKWRRTYHNLTQVCYQCCATSDPKLCCVSIDCPVFHKLIKSTRDLHSEQYLRQLLEGF